MARAFLAGAAIIAGATSPASARDRPEDVALAVPRLRGPGDAGAALPRPLPPSEAALISRIFALQTRGDIPAAVAETAGLGDATLLGHLLADRYLGRFGRASVEDLQGWLRDYAELPDAPAIRSLLVTLTPGPSPVVPAAGDSLDGAAGGAFRVIARNPVLDRSVREAARPGSGDRAIRLIARTRGLDAEYGAVLRAEVAQAAFTQGHDAEAFRLAEAAHRQAQGTVALAPYVAGLAAWRLNQFDTASALFEAAWRAGVSTAELRSASAFWAARARLRGTTPADAAPWMQQAAKEASTFHGLLATHMLDGGQAIGAGETLGEADAEALLATPHGLRALALLQVGQPARAAAELRLLWPATLAWPGLRRSVLLVAREADLTDQLAVAAAGPLRGDIRPLPAPRLRSIGGIRVDLPMLYAMARVESNFRAEAVSPAGARGLLQIMPLTARYIADKTNAPEQSATRLHDPDANLDLAQRYILYLAEHGAVEDNLVRLLAAYNAGPGSLRRWDEAVRPSEDPLLFLEMIPYDETRAYVPRVLALTWLYAAQMRLPAPSLDALAAGRWPRFTPADVRRPSLARLH